MKKLTSLVLVALLFASLSGCAMPNGAKQTKPDGQHFIDFMQNTHFSAWVRGDAATAKLAFEEGLGAWNAQGLLSSVRKYYNSVSEETTTVDRDGRGYFRTDEINEVSEDILGYPYEFWSKTTTGAKEEGLLFEIPLDFKAGEGLFDTLKPDTLLIQNEQLQIESVVTAELADTGELQEWTVRYTFEYMPENAYIPYRFLFSKVIAGTQVR